MRTILLATVGTSPAVLTETVWALAHPRKNAERVIPDEVVALTTLRGKQEIETLLLGAGGGWERMVAALRRERIPVEGRLSFGDASIRLLDHGKAFLDDIRPSARSSPPPWSRFADSAAGGSAQGVVHVRAFARLVPKNWGILK
jgi:CRISPR-associated protein (TIGR02584 family)